MCPVKTVDPIFKPLEIIMTIISGGYFFGTTCWSEELVRRWREVKRKGKDQFGNAIYSITFPEGSPDPPGIFNATYHFKLEEQVDIAEFLVYFPVLKDICEQNGLKCKFFQVFKNFQS